jgi:hypothetical protein
LKSVPQRSFKKEINAESKTSPLTKEDLSFKTLDFYPINEKFRPTSLQELKKRNRLG